MEDAQVNSCPCLAGTVVAGDLVVSGVVMRSPEPFYIDMNGTRTLDTINESGDRCGGRRVEQVGSPYFNSASWQYGYTRATKYQLGGSEITMPAGVKAVVLMSQTASRFTPVQLTDSMHYALLDTENLFIDCSQPASGFVLGGQNNPWDPGNPTAGGIFDAAAAVISWS